MSWRPLLLVNKHQLNCIYLFILLGLLSNSAYSEEISQKIVFCYENKSFPPHFLGESMLVPKENPGAVIDILKDLDKKLKTIHIVYVRQPWSRCLQELKLGEVTAVLGSFSDKRAEYGAYPERDGYLDKSKAFDYLATCFIRNKDQKVTWDGKKVNTKEQLTVAIPLGYAVKKNLEKLGFAIYQTNSLESSYHLLKSNRVLLSIIDCESKKLPGFATVIKPPVREHYGYMILNKFFYQSNPTLSNDIWDELAKFDKKKYRAKYLNE